MNKRRLIPLFTAFVLWGSQYVISKIALRTVPPVTLLALAARPKKTKKK